MKLIQSVERCIGFGGGDSLGLGTDAQPQFALRYHTFASRRHAADEAIVYRCYGSPDVSLKLEDIGGPRRPTIACWSKCTPPR